MSVQLPLYRLSFVENQSEDTFIALTTQHRCNEMLIPGPGLKREPRVVIDYCFHFGSRDSQSILIPDRASYRHESPQFRVLDR